jgi:hypothetical protein
MLSRTISEQPDALSVAWEAAVRRGRGSSDDGAQRSQAKKLNGTHDE